MALNSPKEVIKSAIEIGANKVALSSGKYGKLTVLAMLAGIYISMGGVLSLIIGYGFPEITAGNPSLQRILSGAMFPIGLILVIILGAELFTGNNALLIPSYFAKKHSFSAVLKNWALVYVGNFLGAIMFTYLFVYLCGLTANEPYHSAIIKIAEAKVSMAWITVFLKGIGANWFVCLAVWLALSGKSLLAKMVGCWLPVMVFVALGYEHSIANMFFIPAGIFEGANIEIMQAITTNFIPATLGNIVGGSVFVGSIYYYINRPKE